MIYVLGEDKETKNWVVTLWHLLDTTDQNQKPILRKEFNKHSEALKYVESL